MSGFVARTTALAAVGLLGVSGCSWGSDSHASVSATELQKSLVAKLAQAGTPSTWVNCGKDLPGRVGATTRCDVSFDQANSITAILTTTEVKGDNVTWEITRPEMTKDQVAKRVGGLWQTDAVTCSSGLDGNIGDWAQCEVSKDGMPMTQTLEIKAVQGLSMDITPTLAVQKQQAEDFVRHRLILPDAEPLESVTCPGDLVGTSGTTMDCAVTIAGRQDTYTLSISDAGNGTVDFAVAPPPVPAEPPSAPASIEAAPPSADVNAAAPEPEPEPEPAPVQAFVPKPAPVQAPKPAPPREPTLVDAVPHLPPGTPHLPLTPGGDLDLAPGPIDAQTGGGQVINQTSGDW